MTEARDDTPTPPPDRAPRARRTPKFSLPEHHEEENGAQIEAFLDGPHARRRRPRSHRFHRRVVLALDTAHEWAGALRHEAARSTRYGRAMAILVVDLSTDLDTAGPDGVALRLTEVLGREIRETDRAIRPAPTRFLVLLPETDEDEAAHLASRIERGYRIHGTEGPVTGDIRIEIAVPRRGADPTESIERADRRLADPLATG
jgi:hypothetical protein